VKRNITTADTFSKQKARERIGGCYRSSRILYAAPHPFSSYNKEVPKKEKIYIYSGLRNSARLS